MTLAHTREDIESRGLPRQHRVRQTSLDAYSAIEADLTMNRQEQIVYDTVRLYADGLTRNEIAAITGLRINAVAGRVHSLIESKKKLVHCGKRTDRYSGLENYVVKVKEQ